MNVDVDVDVCPATYGKVKKNMQNIVKSWKRCHKFKDVKGLQHLCSEQARQRGVFPQPGGPVRSKPLGHRAPKLANLDQIERKEIEES